MPIRIIRNDISRVRADAIVCTAAPDEFAYLGSNGALYAAAGFDRIMAARQELGELAPGQAAYTPAFDLNAKYIIHTKGPQWVHAFESDGTAAEKVKDELSLCYKSCFDLALSLKCESIVFPLISTGRMSVPADIGLDAAYSTLCSCLLEAPMDVSLVVFDENALRFSRVLLGDIESFIDENYVAAYSPELHASFMESDNIFYGAPFKSEESAEEGEFDTDLAFTGAAEEKKAARVGSVLKPSARKAALSSSEDSALTPYDSLDALLKASGETFIQRLYRYIDRSGMTDAQVYTRANLTRQTFSKLKLPGHTPKKKTVFALALALSLNADETRDLLESAGQAFSPSEKLDLIVKYCLENDIHNVLEVDALLYDYLGDTLINY